MIRPWYRLVRSRIARSLVRAMLFIGLVGALGATSRPMHAQDVVAADARNTDVDPRVAQALFGRMVTVTLDDVTVKRAVDLVVASAGVSVVYHSDVLAAQPQRITTRLKHVSLRSALEQVLSGTSLAPVPLDATKVAIVSMPSARGMDGGIAGTVTEGKSKRPLRFAIVMLDDSTHVVRTDDDGRYRFVSISVGAHRVIVRHIGFSQQVRVVTAKENETVVADFALSANINTLDQVVVTATGAQRYRELGHIVTKINADSVVREAPVTSLSELLTARVPGLQVLTNNGGIAGGEVALRVRGTSTTSLDPQPIVIVDGVRYKSTNFTAYGEDYRPFNTEPRSPLNDLNVNDIETVEVVKGPSASTLYGPDAANGVIVVTTKRGRAGAPQWHVYAYPDLSTLSVGGDGRLNAQRAYQGWGHIPNTTTLYQGQCTIQAQAAQLCVLDSLTVAPLPSNDPKTSIVAKQRPQWHSGASVSGGTPTLLYFYSGNYDSQTGMLHLSPAAQSALKQQLGVSTLSDAIRTPNSQQTLNLHANISSQLTPKASIGLAANYTQASQRSMDITDLFESQNLGFGAAPGDDSTTIRNIVRSASQWTSFISTSEQQIHRFTTTLNGSFRPWDWLQADASIGTDLDNTADRGVRPANALYNGDGGEADEQRRGNTNRNAHLGATATAHPGIWSFRTSAGADYSYVNQDGLNTTGYNLAPGSSDLSTASSQSVQRQWLETVSLGTYGEEVIGLHDRLFLTGSLRLDGSTSFGDAYQPHPFPKLGASWVASDEPWLAALHRYGVDEIRLRYSYGAASRYPTSAMKLGIVIPENLFVEDNTKATFYRYSLANPVLRPERSRESEYGVDATLLSVVQLGVTWYNRKTDDELQLLAAPNGFLGGWANVGDLTARGFETTVDVRVFESNRATGTMRFTYANNTNIVRSVGAASQSMSELGSVVVGYPINAAFGSRTIGAVDSAGGVQDGFISNRDEVLSSPLEYLGPLIAPKTYTITPALALFGGQIRVTTLFDRQSGGVQFNGYAFLCVIYNQCPSGFLKSTPLVEQAKGLLLNRGDFIQSSNFTRWRELSVTGELPLVWRQRFHLTQASVSAQVRNLALWTPYTAPDPESTTGLGVMAVGGGATGGAAGIPQPRSWTIRFDITP